MGQMGGGDLHDQPALHRALVGHAHLSDREVAQAPVDELGGPARRTEGEVVRVDGEHREPAGDRVEGDAGAGDAQPDDDDVDLGGRAGQARGDALAHGWRVLVRRVVSSSSSWASVASSSIIVWTERTKPWVARTSPRAMATGLPFRISPACCPSAIAC